MDVVTMAEKLGGEVVMGRVVGRHDGKRVYLTDIGGDGRPFINAAGEARLKEVEDAPASATATKPKRGKRGDAGTASDVEIEI